MSDALLPCFPFRPNWGEGVQERLEFRSTVLRADEGAEQRQSVRQTPRRTIEAEYLLIGPERAFFDVWMHRLSARAVTVPLYWDVALLTAATEAGVTTRLEFDTRFTEFAAGKTVILQGKRATDFEVVEVSAVDDDGIDLEAATGHVWPVGTRVMPLRRAYVEDLGELDHASASVANTTVRFQINDANPWTPAADGSPTYGGLPILENEPNWVAGLGAELRHDVVRFDPGVGLVYQTDPVGRANVGQEHRYFLEGRESLAGIRDLLYRHQGRRGEFWLPSFKRDLELVGSVLSTDTQIEIENIGLSYAGGPGSGREHIIIWTNDGQRIVRRITDSEATGDTETLDLDAAMGLDLSPGLVRKISFLDTARFDQDEFELTHLTDSQGLTELTTTFRTFPRIRTAPAPLEYPIPLTEENGVPCGVPPFGVFTVDARTNAATTATGLLSTGTVIDGVNPTDILYLVLPPGQAEPGGWSPWGDPSPINPGSSGANSRLYVIPDDNAGAVYQVGSATLADGYEAARQNFGTRTLTGASKYTLGIIDSPITDNTGGFTIFVYRLEV